jgi:hypothetical protein
MGFRLSCWGTGALMKWPTKDKCMSFDRERMKQSAADLAAFSQARPAGSTLYAEIGIKDIFKTRSEAAASWNQLSHQ